MVASSKGELVNLKSNKKPRSTTITAPEEFGNPNIEAIHLTVRQEDMKPRTSDCAS